MSIKEQLIKAKAAWAEAHGCSPDTIYLGQEEMLELYCHFNPSDDFYQSLYLYSGQRSTLMGMTLFAVDAPNHIYICRRT